MSGGRILGIDYGEKRVGVALSDPIGLTAQPLCLLERKSDAQLAEALGALAAEHEAERIVVGVPVGLGGGDTLLARRARRFAARLRAGVSVPVEKWDERLTTAEAERALDDMEVQRRRRTGRRDVMAAQLILQGYLDRHRAETTGPS